MLYGHVHNTYDEYLVDRFQKETLASNRTNDPDNPKNKIPCQMINCFCMFSNYVPLTLDEWIELDHQRRQNINEEDYHKQF